eukprot:2870718-Rhodomonas_salina.3
MRYWVMLALIHAVMGSPPAIWSPRWSGERSMRRKERGTTPGAARCHHVSARVSARASEMQARVSVRIEEGSARVCERVQREEAGAYVPGDI